MMAGIKPARRVVIERPKGKRRIIVIYPNNGATIDCSESCGDDKEDRPYRDMKKKNQPEDDRD